jgi:hypothetical protein
MRAGDPRNRRFLVMARSVRRRRLRAEGYHRADAAIQKVVDLLAAA